MPCRRWAARWPSSLRSLIGLFLLGLLVPLGFLLDLLFGEFDFAAGGLDHRARALRRLHFLQNDLARELAGEDHLRGERLVRDDSFGLERRQVDVRRLHRLELADTHLDDVAAREGLEAALGQAAMQRHLAALEADLVEAARAGLLALVPAARGLAPARAAAAADAMPVLLRARCGLQGIQSHGLNRRFARAT